nr:hypothetical protein [uncultured Pseudomonas sp.]
MATSELGTIKRQLAEFIEGKIDSTASNIRTLKPRHDPFAQGQLSVLQSQPQAPLSSALNPQATFTSRNQALESFVESRINATAGIIWGSEAAEVEEQAFGQVNYLLSVRRMLDGTATSEDVGLHTAISHVLRELKVLDLLENNGLLQAGQSYTQLFK